LTAGRERTIGQQVDCSTYEDSKEDEIGGKGSSDFRATDERDVHDQKHDAVYTQIYATDKELDLPPNMLVGITI